MDAMNLTCPSCQKVLKSKNSMPAGKPVKCPGCKSVFKVPANGQAAPPPARAKVETRIASQGSSAALQADAKKTSLQQKRPRDDDEEFDRPRKKTSRDDDDRDDDRPRKKSSRDDDERDDDRPRKKRPLDDDDDRPRKKRRDDVEEDEDRPRKKGRDDDDDDDRPRKSRGKGGKRKRKNGSATMIIIGASVGGVLLIAFIVTAFVWPGFLMKDGQGLADAGGLGRDGGGRDGGGGLFAPAAGGRQQSVANMKQIGLAMHSYHDTFQQLPPVAMCGKDGKPLLSWRVAILPYIEELPLYGQFKHDEPWDSPHNKKLLPLMPRIYAPVGTSSKEPYTTYYQVFKGKGTAFELAPNPTANFGASGMRFADVTDGLSNTIAVVEAGEPVPWSKPADLEVSDDGPMPKVGGMFKSGFNVLFVDASVSYFSTEIDDATLRSMIRRNSGEIRPLDKIDKYRR